MEILFLTLIILYIVFWVWAYFDAKRAIVLEDEIK